MFLAACTIAATALAVFIPDLLWRKIYRQGLSRIADPRPGAPARVLTKYAGLIGSLCFVGFFYWIFPEYANPTPFLPDVLELPAYACCRWLALLALPYLWWADQRMAEPEERLVAHGPHRDRTLARHGLRSGGPEPARLADQGIFPCRSCSRRHDAGLRPARDDRLFRALHSFQQWYDFGYFAAFFADVSLVTMGLHHVAAPDATRTCARRSRRSSAGSWP